MKSPNMSAMTDSLELSLRNCSLNHHFSSDAGTDASASRAASVGFSSSSSSSSSSSELHEHTTLELNSHLPLPPFWEQCLDLDTGELYYINCKTGMKVKEDPRRIEEHSGSFYSEDDVSSTDDSEESSSSSSCSWIHRRRKQQENDDVLVVAGCKRCFMYFMVAKQVEDCPKCGGHLFHFDRSDNNFQ